MSRHLHARVRVVACWASFSAIVLLVVGCGGPVGSPDHSKKSRLVHQSVGIGIDSTWDRFYSRTDYTAGRGVRTDLQHSDDREDALWLALMTCRSDSLGIWTTLLVKYIGRGIAGLDGSAVLLVDGATPVSVKTDVFRVDRTVGDCSSPRGCWVEETFAIELDEDQLLTLANATTLEVTARASEKRFEGGVPKALINQARRLCELLAL